MVREYTFVNLFRAIAAFWVLSEHCMVWGGWYGIPIPPAKIAVDLFMIISGFLMAANAEARNTFEPLSTARNRTRFWLRRYFRIAPAYYLSLALAVLIGSFFLGGYQELQKLNPAQWPAGSVYDPARFEYSPRNILLHVSFLFGLHPTHSFSTFLPDWSLSLEMQFYAAFPFLYLAMRRFGCVKSALVIGLPVFALGLVISSRVFYYEPSLLLFKLNFFLAGMVLHRALTGNERGMRRFALAAAALLLVSLDRRYGSYGVVPPLLLLGMLALGRWEETGRTPAWISWVINSRLVRFASDTSYGVYLFHGFLISSTGWIIAGNDRLLALTPPSRVLFMFVYVTALAYPLAWLVYRWVELPGIRLGKRVIERVAPPADRAG